MGGLENFDVASEKKIMQYSFRDIMDSLRTDQFSFWNSFLLVTPIKLL